MKGSAVRIRASAFRSLAFPPGDTALVMKGSAAPPQAHARRLWPVSGTVQPGFGSLPDPIPARGCKEIANLRCLGMDFAVQPFYNSYGRSGVLRGFLRGPVPGGRIPSGPPATKGIPLNETIHLHDLTPAERLVEEAAERGFIEEKEIQAFADEHELPEEELTALRTELDERDVIVRAEVR